MNQYSNMNNTEYNTSTSMDHCIYMYTYIYIYVNDIFLCSICICLYRYGE